MGEHQLIDQNVLFAFEIIASCVHFTIDYIEAVYVELIMFSHLFSPCRNEQLCGTFYLQKHGDKAASLEQALMSALALIKYISPTLSPLESRK